jgi:hypothetical protein
MEHRGAGQKKWRLTQDAELTRFGHMPNAPRTKKIALRAKRPAKKAAKKPAVKKEAKPVKRSHLEVRWIREWERQGGPELVEEFMFHPTRKWRADFAHLESKLLIEIEGGAYGGRHTRGKGFVEDLDKYASAWLHGYTVLRIGSHQVRSDIIRAVIGRIKNHSPESWDNSPESCGEGAGGRAAADENSPGGVLWRACGHSSPVPDWLAVGAGAIVGAAGGGGAGPRARKNPPPSEGGGLRGGLRGGG